MKGHYFLSFTILLLLLTGCSTENPEDKISVHSNDLVLGASAREFLSDELFTALDLELVYVTGHPPTQGSINSLYSFLERNINKPDGINIQTRAIPSPGVGSYNIQEIKEVEKNNRTAFSKGEKLAVFVFFADNKSADVKEGRSTLGKAYMNTSIIIFDSEIKAITNSSTSHSQVQTITLHHEFGHLFGLVDNGSPAQTAHEDSNPDNRAHCNVEGCLMAAIIDVNSSPLSFLEGGQKILDFDDKCKLDLKANGGK